MRPRHVEARETAVLDAALGFGRARFFDVDTGPAPRLEALRAELFEAIRLLLVARCTDEDE